MLEHLGRNEPINTDGVAQRALYLKRGFGGASPRLAAANEEGAGGVKPVGFHRLVSGSVLYEVLD